MGGELTEQAEVEIVIGSRDDAVVSDIETRLAELEPVRWRDARFVDPVTILAVGTGITKLVEALIALKRDLSSVPDAPRVEVKTPDGRSIVLTDATPELLTAALSETRMP
jgi:hypothetical protein